MNLRNLRLIVLSIISSLAISACGSSTVVHKSVKNFRLSLDPRYKQLEPTFVELIDSFNHHAGFTALRLVDAPDKANSTIVITNGLTDAFHKVGFGQWIIETQENKSVTAQGAPLVTKIDHYEMRIEFDQSFVGNLALHEGDSSSRYELEKLFFHEVGHGMQMEHSKDESDVMFENIGGQKDFDRFFARVHDFYDK